MAIFGSNARVPLDPIFTPGEIYTPPLPTPVIGGPPIKVDTIIKNNWTSVKDGIKDAVNQIKVPPITGTVKVGPDNTMIYIIIAVFALLFLNLKK